MSEALKSIRLYCTPNAKKRNALLELQKNYTDGINTFIGLLWDEDSLWKDIFWGTSTSPSMRAYEKAHRISSLGCALSQTAMDEATEKLSQTYQDIRTEMLNIIDSGDDEYIFVLSKALFDCSLAGKSLSETKELLYPHVTEEN